MRTGIRSSYSYCCNQLCPKSAKRLIAVLSAIGFAGFTPAAEGEEQGGPLPSPPAIVDRLTDYQPANPYTEFGSGALVRSRHRTADERGFAFETLDLMIGPGKKADKLQFQGAMIIEVRSGAGIFTFAGQTRELSLGGILSISARTDIGIANRDPKAPLILRGTLIHGRPQ